MSEKNIVETPVKAPEFKVGDFVKTNFSPRVGKLVEFLPANKLWLIQYNHANAGVTHAEYRADQLMLVPAPAKK